MKKVLLASVALLCLINVSPVSADGGMMPVSPSPVTQPAIQPVAIATYTELVNKIVIGVLEMFDWKNADGEISFTDTNYSAKYDCNTMFGTYSLQLSAVDLHTPAMTEMACETAAMEADQELVNDLALVETLTFKDGMLILSGTDTNLSFTAMLPEAE
jgi:heat shock protein HslJ